jgi:propanol-preferring alcohol dehydrogenase
MRAAVQEQVGAPLVIRDVPMPEVGRRDALVRMEACGVCHSDLHLADGFFRPLGIDVFPIIPGHEMVGVVEEVGADVKHVKPGDRVGAYFFQTCGLCGNCFGGHETACATLFTAPMLSGFSIDGGYAEYMAAPAEFLLPLPDEISFEEAAPLFCGGVTAYGGLKSADVRAGQRVAILGVGGIGHLALQIARAMGAEVVAITSPGKGEWAREQGADIVITGNGDTGAQLRDVGGADVVLSTTVDPHAISSVLQGLRLRGSLVVLGMTADPLSIMPAAFAFGQQRIIGSIIGTRQDQAQLLEMAVRHRIRPLTEAYPLARVNEAHERLRNQKVRLRAVLTPN